LINGIVKKESAPEKITAYREAYNISFRDDVKMEKL